MNILIIVLRLFHILAGAFWVGAAFVNTFFLAPTMAATGEAGQKFVAHLVSKARLSARVTVASYITVIAGAILYWIDSQGFSSPWQKSGPGIGFGLGAIAALIGFGFGQMVGKNATVVAKLAAQIQGTPTPEQAAALEKARAKMRSAGNVSTASLVLALILMAIARYLVL